MITKPTQYPDPTSWKNQIICEDNLEVLKQLPDNCIDLVLTSPPYNFGKEYDSINDEQEWDKYFTQLFQVLDECVRVLKYGGRMVINIMPNNKHRIPTHHKIMDYLIEQGLIWKAEIIWNKNNSNSMPFLGSYGSPSSPYFKYTHEYVLVFCKGDRKKKGDRENVDLTPKEYTSWTRTVWNIPAEIRMKKLGHPAMFPERLVERIIKLLTYQGDTILDPYNGLGTTCLVANELNRNYIGIDISEEYCNKARKRLESG